MTLLSLGDVGSGSRRTMRLQWILRWKETLGCVWTTVSTSGTDGEGWLGVCVGAKKENLQVGLFTWWWSLSVRVGGGIENPPGAWAGEKLSHVSQSLLLRDRHLSLPIRIELLRKSSVPYFTNIWNAGGDEGLKIYFTYEENNTLGLITVTCLCFSTVDCNFHTARPPRNQEHPRMVWGNRVAWRRPA